MVGTASLADRRRSTSSRNYHSNENVGGPTESSYVHVTVDPLVGTSSGWNCARAYIAVLHSLVSHLHSKTVIFIVFFLAIFSVCLLWLFDIPYLILRVVFLAFTLFSVACAFCWFALLFRQSWSTSCAYVLFCACFIGEIASRVTLTFEGSTLTNINGRTTCLTSKCSNVLTITPYYARLSELSVFLMTVITASSFNNLSLSVNGLLISLVTLVRYLAYTTLVDLPLILRPYAAYISGICGIFVAQYTEMMFKSTISTSTNHEGKVLAVRRRRTSTTFGHHGSIGSSVFSNANEMRNRRTSLPALSGQKVHQTNHLLGGSSTGSNWSLDIALLSEAHGLISDMLADKSSLPPHIISGLQALSNLLSPPNHMSSHQQRQRGIGGAVVSLADFSGSDTEENLPYTGERPSALPKRFKKNVPQSLLRRMSTSTWTTTTSATGMPTLEPEPCRKRSTSFRHPPELSPTSATVGGMSNSLSLPASISNSTNNGIMTDVDASDLAVAVSSGPVSGKGRSIKDRERKTVCSLHPLTASDLKKLQTEFKEEKCEESSVPTTDDRDSSSLPYSEKDCSTVVPSQGQKSAPGKSGVTTSDYDSCESPCGSEISENTATNLDISDRSDSIVAKDRPWAESQDSQDLDETSPDITNHPTINKHNANNIPRVSISTDQQTAKISVKSSCDTVNIKKLQLNCDLNDYSSDSLLDDISEWDYPIFELEAMCPNTILSKMCHRVFLEVGLFETFKIPMKEFLNYFCTLEGGYREKPYHNKMHAADVLHSVFYLTSQAIPGFIQIPPECSDADSSADKSNSTNIQGFQQRQSFVVDDSYGVMGANLPALELMALYTAAAMHDYDHPGRTNAFLVTINAPLAVLYNDRSVLENHHAAAAWNLFLSDPSYNFLQHLDKAEFKRFRFLVIEAILATDLKRHFEILTEFNAKVNIDDAPGIDWQSEADRMLVMQMCIKLADINGPCKQMDLHTRWTRRIAEEFYEQGDEESTIGLPISPFMDRRNPQLAKLQESFINHLVAPLCNAYGESGLLPGQWVESDDSDDEDSETVKSETDSKDTEDEGSFSDINSDPTIQRHINRIPAKKIICLPAKHIQDNYDYWIKIIKDESRLKEQKISPNPSRSPSPSEENFSDASSSTIPGSRKGSDEMETIHEEEVNSHNSQIL